MGDIFSEKNLVKPTESDYLLSKDPNRTYMSKGLLNFNKDSQGNFKMIRIVSKVIDVDKTYRHIKEGNETVLRITPGGRHEIIAKIYEDTRDIFVLTIQRFDKLYNRPIKSHFSFVGKEIQKLKDFLDSIKFLAIDGEHKERYENIELQKIKELLRNGLDTEVITDLIQNNITKDDVVAIGYRKNQLELFRKLLDDQIFFENKKKEWGKTKSEDLWQTFFEKNPWIFGYGLSYIFNSPLDGKKLEQYVSGGDVSHTGKRPDALLKSRGIVSSLCLVEIKNHTTKLLENNPYRSGAWAASNELTGGIAQSQKTIQKTIENIGISPELKTYDKNGDPLGENVYSYKPKSYLIIGNLDQFQKENGLNIEQYSSFELFRKNISSPEIITFDELYERARFIIQNNNKNYK